MNFYIINGVLEVYKMFFHIFGKKIGIQVLEVKNLNLHFSILEISWRIEKDNRRMMRLLPKLKK